MKVKKAVSGGGHSAAGLRAGLHVVELIAGEAELLRRELDVGRHHLPCDPAPVKQSIIHCHQEGANCFESGASCERTRASLSLAKLFESSKLLWA